MSKTSYNNLLNSYKDQTFLKQKKIGYLSLSNINTLIWLFEDLIPNTSIFDGKNEKT